MANPLPNVTAYLELQRSILEKRLTYMLQNPLAPQGVGEVESVRETCNEFTLAIELLKGD